MYCIYISSTTVYLLIADDYLLAVCAQRPYDSSFNLYTSILIAFIVIFLAIVIFL